jgi:hypothetical protein
VLNHTPVTLAIPDGTHRLATTIELARQLARLQIPNLNADMTKSPANLPGTVPSPTRRRVARYSPGPANSGEGPLLWDRPRRLA